MLRHSEDNWTPAIMFQGILGSAPTLEETNISIPMSSLVPPVGTPAVPEGFENSSMDPRCHKLRKVNNPPGHASAVMTWQARDASISSPPPLHLVPDSFDYVWSTDMLDGSEGTFLKFMFYLTHIIMGPKGATRGDPRKNGHGGDAFAF